MTRGSLAAVLCSAPASQPRGARQRRIFDHSLGTAYKSRPAAADLRAIPTMRQCCHCAAHRTRMSCRSRLEPVRLRRAVRARAWSRGVRGAMQGLDAEAAGGKSSQGDHFVRQARPRHEGPYDPTWQCLRTRHLRSASRTCRDGVASTAPNDVQSASFPTQGRPSSTSRRASG